MTGAVPPAAYTSVQSFVDERLKGEGIGLVTRERFAEIASRLLAAGVIWREYSRAEAQLYEDAVQCDALLREWFLAVGFGLAHDVDAGLFRLYPPAADESEDDGVGRLHARLTRDFVAACIALRWLYTEGLTGKRDLVNQELPIALEELAQAMTALLGHALPASAAERVALLRELRRHRVIRFQEGESAGAMDAGVSVLRPVMTYVSDEALEEALRLAGPVRPAPAEPSFRDRDRNPRSRP
ncbi:MAG TPA: DUF4194 domain-containing protein [Burkholderiaceae bacterium]|nr:DUF4194 domain-containing protein [Burkholderiaceae bacterium]